MTKEHFETLKEEYIEHITEYVKDTGGLFPHISIFAEHKDKSDTKPALIHVPISDEFMETDKGKDLFVDEMLPMVAKKVVEDFKVYAIAWSSEAWMRMADKDDDITDWKALPIKKEVIFITIETLDEKTDSVMYEINRKGQQVNSDGELTDHIELTKSEMSGLGSVGGRFSGLLKHFKQRDKND